MQGLSGRIGVVTGAAGGIGRAVAHRIASEGSAVLVTDVDAEGAEAVAKEICTSGGRAAALGVDVRDETQVRTIPGACLTDLGGPPSLFVSNAGYQTFASIGEIDEEQWRNVFDVNAHGSFLTMRMAADCLERHQLTGTIVTIASIQARVGSVYYAHYSASKAAVLSLTKSFALSLAPRGSRVNCVAPGVIDTDLWAKADREMARMRGIPAGVPKRERIAQVPLGRGGTPADVAAAVAFLSSDDAAYVTGECLHVCGGDIML